LKRLGLALVGVACALGLAEAGLRAFVPRLHPSAQLLLPLERSFPLGEPDTAQRHTKPGAWSVSVRFGPDGLRDPRALDALPEDALFLVGDSFAFGYGVEEGERLSAHLERALKRPVFPLAMPGLAPPEERDLIAWAEERGARVDELVLLFTMENDFGYFHLQPRDETGEAPWTPRGASTALGMLVRDVVARSPVLAGIAVDLGLKARPYDSLDREVPDEALASTLDVIDDLARDRRARIALVPSRALYRETTRAQEREVHARTIAGLRELGLEVIDLAPALSLADHYEADPHWTPAGHEKAAAAVARALSE
jgi:hypothetical protein